MISTSIYTQEFLEIALRKDGKISPKSINELYFKKLNKEYLWQHFLQSTSIFEQYDISDRIFFLINNITKVNFCSCGNICMTVNYTTPKSYSKYCSAKCSRLDKIPRIIGASKRDITSSNEKRKNTMVEKYGVAYNSQRSDIKITLSNPKVSAEIFEKLSNYEWIHEHYIIKKLSSVEIGNILGCYYGTVIEYLKKHNIELIYNRSSSKEETEIKEFIESLGFDVVQSDRTMLGENLELDIFIPRKNVAIELNGSYWHSYNHIETKIEKHRHKKKTVLARDKNINLLQITDIEWNTQRELVESMICNKLGISKKLNARDYRVRNISYKNYRSFCDKNHISGMAKAIRVYGLIDKQDNIMAILSFDKSRFNKKAQWEIIRFCSLQNTSIRGGFSKLLKHFITQESPSSIGTYSDNRYGNGGVYSTNGFIHENSTDPGYCWTNTVITLNRYLCQKKKLSSLLGVSFNIDESESENMFRSKYRRMWDAGHEYFILTI